MNDQKALVKVPYEVRISSIVRVITSDEIALL